MIIVTECEKCIKSDVCTYKDGMAIDIASVKDKVKTMEGCYLEFSVKCIFFSSKLTSTPRGLL